MRLALGIVAVVVLGSACGPKATQESPEVQTAPPGIVGGVLVSDADDAPAPLDEHQGVPNAPAAVDDPSTLTQAERDRVAAIRDREMAPLTNDPLWKPYILRSIEGVTDPEVAFERGRVLGEALTRRGIGRLPAPRLDRWSALRLALAKHSLTMCAGLHAGNVPPEVLEAAMSALSDDELADITRLSADAGVLELHAQTPLKADNEALREGLRLISAKLSTAEQERFMSALTSESTSADDQCFVTMAIHSQAATLDDTNREQFLRALAIGIGM